MSYFQRFKKLDLENIPHDVIFYLCFPLDEDENEIRHKVNESRFNDSNHLYKYKLLKKNDLELYTDFLYQYMINWIESKPKIKSTNELNRVNSNYYDELIELAKMLKIVYQNKKNNFEVTLTNISGGKASLNDVHFNQKVAKIIEDEFIFNDLNHISLSYEDAKAEMIRFDDLDWFNDLHVDGNYMDCYDGYSFFPEKITDEDIIFYADDHAKTYDNLNVDLINQVIENLQFRKNNSKLISGSTPKNTELSRLCVSLSYLHRFHRFLNQSEFNNIYDYPLFSDTNVFIYDYLNYWGLINNKVQYIDKVLKANYVKAVINQNKKKRGLYTEDSTFKKETLINKIRLAKFGKYEFINSDGIHIIDSVKERLEGKILESKSIDGTLEQYLKEEYE